ncbi:hypothetical protein LTS18_012769, partial [Coniosporium uncinatum]
MAPIIKKRTSIRAKAHPARTSSAAKPRTTYPVSSDDGFTTTKKDKRIMKHSLLMSKVQKSQARPKRRRPNKKLVANLESLADALPDADANGGEGAGAGIESRDKVVDQATIRQKSLKSRPGALKRREK